VSAYRLYAMESIRLLSVHDGYEDALAAADAHTLAVLATANDWVTVETCIVGPGPRGPLTVHPVVTHLGPPDDVDGARCWLREVRCRTRGKWF
jgi:hypothetical protein